MVKDYDETEVKQLDGHPVFNQDKNESLFIAPIESIVLMVVVVIAAILALFLFPVKANAEEVNVKTIAQMESSGNPFARNGSHIGMCQIGKEVLHDYNKANSTHWEQEDLFNGVLNMRIASWYLNKELPKLLKHYHRPDTLENRLTAWRWGVGKVLQNYKASKYIAWYKRTNKGEL